MHISGRGMKSLIVLILAVLPVVSFCIHCDPQPGTPPNAPLGKARGVHPGRVAWVHDASSTNWDGESNYWWSEKYTNQDTISSMFSDGLKALAGVDTDEAAWNVFFKDFNQRHFGESRGYKVGEKIAVKLNLNGFLGSYGDSNANGLSPQFLKALLRQLVGTVGAQQEDICVYDASRWIVDSYWKSPEGVHDEFPHVHYVDNAGQEGREKVQADNSSHLQFSSTDVPLWNFTLLPTCVTEANYVVETDNFRGHDMAGVTLSGKNWFGSVWRPVKGYVCGPAGYWCPMSLHNFANATGREMGTYNVLVDLLGHKHLGAKVVLFIMDGIYGGPYEQPVPPVRFTMEPFNNHWSSSVFFSQDPIALDSVAYDFLRNEKNVPYAHEGCVDNYMHEAALADDPPSGTAYNPTGEERLKSLGVHEHWNNVQDKKYSRNLSTGDGIELVTILK